MTSISLLQLCPPISWAAQQANRISSHTVLSTSSALDKDVFRMRRNGCLQRPSTAQPCSKASVSTLHQVWVLDFEQDIICIRSTRTFSDPFAVLTLEHVRRTSCLTMAIIRVDGMTFHIPRRPLQHFIHSHGDFSQLFDYLSESSKVLDARRVW